MNLFGKNKASVINPDEVIFDIKVTEQIDEDGESRLQFYLYTFGKHGRNWTKGDVFADVNGGDRFIITRQDLINLNNGNNVDLHKSTKGA